MTTTPQTHAITPKTTIAHAAQGVPLPARLPGGLRPRVQEAHQPGPAAHDGAHGDARARRPADGGRAARPAHERHRRRGRRSRPARAPTSPTTRPPAASTRRAWRRSRQIIEDLHAGQPDGRAHARASGSSSRTSRPARSRPWSSASSRMACPKPRSSASATCTCRCSPARSTPTTRSSAPAGHPDRHVPAREPGAAAGHGLAAQGRRARSTSADDQAEAWTRLKPALAAAARARARDRTCHYLRKETPALPVPRAARRRGPDQGDVGAARRRARGAQGDRGRARRRRRRAGRARRPSGCAQTAEDMVTKEEKVLFPMALETLSDAEWAEIRAGEEEIGYALRRPAWRRGRPAARRPRPAPAGRRRPAGVRRPPRPQHRRLVSLEELNLDARRAPHRLPVRRRARPGALLQRGRPHLPAQPGRDRPQGAELPPAGRACTRCSRSSTRSAPASKSTAEFWIELGGRFLHIRYFAVRDAAGAYRGVVETVQDVTGIRALEGQRRLLDW